MTKQEAINYCYKHEKQYKSDLYKCGDNGDRQFQCLMAILESGTIEPDEIKDYGMNY